MGKPTADHRAIYALLVEKAQDKGYAKLAYATIARYTRIDVEIVKACIRDLAAHGIIIIERVPDSSNKYWITDDMPEPEPVSQSIRMPEPKYYLFA